MSTRSLTCVLDLSTAHLSPWHMRVIDGIYCQRATELSARYARELLHSLTLKASK